MSTIIGEGSYGCVLKPNIPCKNTPSNARRISKFFTNSKEFKKERDIMKMIGDRELYVASCELPSKDLPEALKDCKILTSATNDAKHLRQIIYNYKGDDLSKLVRSIRSENLYIDLFKGMKKVINTLEAINKKGYQHMDIKLGNLVFDGKEVTIIDYGLLTSKENVYTRELNYIHSHVYDYYPPEFKIFSYQRDMDTVDKVIKKITSNYSKHVYSSLRTHGFTFEELSNIIQNNDCFVPDKVDIFSLGIVFLNVLNHIQEIDSVEKDAFLDLMINADPKQRSDYATISKAYDNLVERIKNSQTKKLTHLKNIY
jgi:serine/threonine protein kinase